MAKKPQKITASAIIVDFQKAKKVKKAVAGFLAQKGDFSREILIADNSENPKNAEILRQISGVNFLKIFPKNIGYSRANNFCAQKARGDFLFFLNPDIEFLDKNCVQKILDFFRKNPDAAVVGPRQRNPDGRFEPTARDFPDFLAVVARRTFLRIFFRHRVKKYEISNFDFQKTQSVPWLQSSFWAVRRDFFEKMGGFSERFFCFFADTDFCRRVKKSGKKVIFFADAEVADDGIRASSGGFLSFLSKKIVRVHLFDALKYFFKNKKREKK